MGRVHVPAWLRRGAEAGVFAALLSLLTVVAIGWEHQGPGPVILPAGLGAGLVLALPVLSVGVLAIAYPIAMAATRGDAILGAVTGWLVAADLLAVTTAMVGQRILLPAVGVTVPLGVLAGLCATPAALGGLLAASLLTRLGFGRRAGRVAAIAATAVATPILAVLVPLAA